MLVERRSAYTLALLAVGAGVVIKLAVSPPVPVDYPPLLLFAAVALAAWFGGLGPALAATVVAAAAWLALPAPWAERGPGLLPGILLLLAGGAAVAVLAERLHAARREAERSAVQSARFAAELRDAARRKDEFVALLAHELRTPLAPMMHSVELLRSRSVDGEAATALARVERQVRHLARLIDDLLDLSRLERGQIELRPEPMDLAEVVNEAVDAHRPLLEAAGLEMRLDLPDRRAAMVGDPARLEQITANLLLNAAHHTAPGGTVSVSCRREGEELVLEVRDTGAGIRPELLERIFEPFTRGDTPAAGAHRGLGMGLALVRDLAILHGGWAAADSPGPHQGSRFTVRLPAAGGSAEGGDEAHGRPETEGTRADTGRSEAEHGQPVGAAPERAVAVPAGGARRRVLVVEDHRDAAASLCELLELWDREVRLAASGEEAIPMAAEFRPDVALVDVGLPGIDGYEVARRLRAGPGGGAMLLVALTGFGQERDRRRAERAGFDEHLTKPVPPARLRRLLEEGPDEDQGRAGATPRPVSPSPTLSS